MKTNHFQREFEAIKQKGGILLVLVAATTLITLSIEGMPATAAVGDSAPMQGYLWSDTVGWIDTNCLNTSSCGSNQFGFSVASDGTISGYAWSEHIGWVSANASDVSGCPSGPCTPTLAGGSVSGWMRALGGGTSQSGGWDGFISLSGSGYGVSKGAGAYFSGYAWGDTNVGWVDFSQAYLVASCVPQNICVGNDYSWQDAYCGITTIKSCTESCTPSGCSEDLDPPTSTLRAEPFLVRQGGSAKIFWSSSNANSCSVTGNGDSWSGLASPAGGQTTSAINDKVTYTLSCTGDGGSSQQTVTINIIPRWREI